MKTVEELYQELLDASGQARGDVYWAAYQAWTEAREAETNALKAAAREKFEVSRKADADAKGEERRLALSQKNAASKRAARRAK